MIQYPIVQSHEELLKCLVTIQNIIILKNIYFFFQPNKKQNYKCKFKPLKLMLVTESVSFHPQRNLCPMFSGSGIITSSMSYKLSSVTFRPVEVTFV